MNGSVLIGRSSSLEVPRSNRNSFLSLIIGLVVGFCLAELFLSSSQPDWLPYSTHQHYNNHDAHSSYDLIEAVGPDRDIGSHEHSDENRTIAAMLEKEVKILCWIMTNPANHQTKARHVKRTWGKRCNTLLFMSSKEDENLEVVALPVQEGRNHLWAKTKEAFKYIYKNHFTDADWFFKADDDTYSVIENMRYMLYPYHADTPVYFGCKFKPFVKQGYMSGGAGYVLSREAVRRLVETGLPDPKICKPGNSGSEDVEIGKCLEKLNVTAGDSRDSQGRGRFFPFLPQFHFSKRNPKFWYWKYIYYKPDEGLDCCSDSAISFHYVSPDQMYVLEYIIYHVSPYGFYKIPAGLPEKLKVGELLRTPSANQSI